MISLRTVLSLILMALLGFSHFVSAAESEQIDFPPESINYINLDSTDVYMPTLEELLGEPIDDFSEIDDLSEFIEDLVAYSKTFIGTRYKIGATGPYAFDCSGFTGYVFRNFGINLLRDSRSQGTQGYRVDASDAMPGDLIFFSGYRAGSVIGHVGLVIEPAGADGNIKFIHASTSQGVRIDNTKDVYYARRFVSVRRIFGEPDTDIEVASFDYFE